MPKIKRKISKKRSKTRRNCIPCNPSMRGMRRINPDSYTKEEQFELVDELVDELITDRKRFYGLTFEQLLEIENHLWPIIRILRKI